MGKSAGRVGRSRGGMGILEVGAQDCTAACQWGSESPNTRAARHPKPRELISGSSPPPTVDKPAQTTLPQAFASLRPWS
eukprot:1830744-Rhodomonas_salina.2